MARIEDRPRPLRVSLIGAGGWARAAHLTALSTRDDAVFDSVYDVIAERANETASEFGFAHVAQDLGEVLDRRPDMCIIASPAALHARQATAALEAGSHLLLEKPIATTAADAWRIVETARARDRQVLLALGWNYCPLYSAARRLLSAQPIGDLEHVCVHMASSTRDLLSGRSTDSSGRADRPALSTTWINPALSGGGFGSAQLSHALGVLFGLVDSGATDLVATTRVGPVEGIELSLAVAGRLERGATLTVSGVALGPGQARQELTLGLYGSRGLVRLDFQQDLLVQVDTDGAEHRHTLEPGAGAYLGTAPALALADLLMGRSDVNESDATVGARSAEVLDALASLA